MMGRLFWKIFLWFWAAMLLVGGGVAWGVSVVYEQLVAEEIAPPFVEGIADARAERVAAILAYGGRKEALRYLHHYDRHPFPMLVLNPQGEDILGHPVLEEVARYATDPGLRETQPRSGLADVTMPDGVRLLVVAPLPRTMAEFREMERWREISHRERAPDPTTPMIQTLQVLTAIAISALVCFWLAWYLAKPIKQLSQATRRLSEGDLSVRVSPDLSHRQDEIAALGREFDHMAERLQSLLDAKKRLLVDVSHELRSPLARMQVASALAQRQAPEASAEFDRIDREIERLGSLIDQVLDVARQNEKDAAIPMDDEVKLHQLLQEIVADTDFEARANARGVHLLACPKLTLQGSEELLRRAVENVVRNAIRHTPPGTTVEVTLTHAPTHATIEVCDAGPGVPQAMMEHIFDPFVRVGEARDREGGGYGLGLAIAQQAMSRHGGTIKAENRSAGGLSVFLDLPLPLKGTTGTTQG
ncbi:MAG: hypothetical protein AUJ55_03515 [Proteobacteria bacterium CG1_02_64_396]|nr:MAG: hypothetical protein AUJ55_03515 [Proteobacteria bacterium CG1_02_64_396]